MEKHALENLKVIWDNLLAQLPALEKPGYLDHESQITPRHCPVN